jgi:hypothetical protein
MGVSNRRNQSVIAFEAGEIIFHEGARGDKMFIILSGEVKLTKKVEDLEIPLHNLKRGSMFGEMALIDNQPRSATAQAVSDVTCTVISKLVFRQKLTSEVPTWMQGMFAMLVQRMRMMIVNSNSNTVGIPGHQVIDVLYLLLRQEQADDDGHLELPWDGIVERITYILGASGLATSCIDDRNRRLFVAKSLDTFGRFDQFCKESFLVERRRKEPEDETKIQQQEQELMGILSKVMGLDEGIHTIEIEEVSRCLESEHKRSLDHYSSAIRRLLNCGVLETAESKVGGLIYSVNFELYKSGNANDDLKPVFGEILENISKLGKNGESIQPENMQTLAGITE